MLCLHMMLNSENKRQTILKNHQVICLALRSQSSQSTEYSHFICFRTETFVQRELVGWGWGQELQSKETTCGPAPGEGVVGEMKHLAPDFEEHTTWWSRR